MPGNTAGHDDDTQSPEAPALSDKLPAFQADQVNKPHAPQLQTAFAGQESAGQYAVKGTKEEKRLEEGRLKEKHWKRWGPYLSERQWVSPLVSPICFQSKGTGLT